MSITETEVAAAFDEINTRLAALEDRAGPQEAPKENVPLVLTGTKNKDIAYFDHAGQRIFIDFAKARAWIRRRN